MNGQKKHWRQMKPGERQRIYNRLKELKPILCEHVKERLWDWGLTNIPNIKELGLVEFNTHSDDARALLRSIQGICLVISLRTGCVITIYRNKSDDNHATLRPEQYTKSLEVSW